jgi:hypothetical protein
VTKDEILPEDEWIYVTSKRFGVGQKQRLMTETFSNRILYGLINCK